MTTYILYGSETGNAQGLAQQTVDTLNQSGHTAILKDMSDVSIADLKTFEKVFIFTSTWGDGEAPSNAAKLHDELASSQENLSGLSFGVFAIGSSAFPMFCQAGINFDTNLERLGAKRIKDLVTADDDFASVFSTWINEVK